ncbi:hypothetical protein Scep_008674 [Stephania cephalantha]|uniref:Transketolase C-terminal domain-containing protein n=1 Tax=Stephania cephalantha TaxID=152367 RepID=A0AAP0PMY5_9MAGN
MVLNSSSTCRSFMVSPHDFIRSPTITKYHLTTNNNNNNNNHHIKFSAVAVSTYHKNKKQYHATRILDDLRISCRGHNHESTAAMLIPHDDHVCCPSPSDDQFPYKVGAAAGSSTLVLPIKSEGTVPLLVQSSSSSSSSSSSIGSAVEQGSSRVLKEGRKVAVMGYGGAALVQSCLTAAAILTVHGLSITVADAAVDDHRDLIWSLAQHHQLLLTVEEEATNSTSRSKFGSQVSRFLSSNGLLHPDRLKWRGMTLPVPEEHSKEAAAAAAGGLNSKHIASTVLSLLSDHQDVFLIM